MRVPREVVTFQNDAVARGLSGVVVLAGVVELMVAIVSAALTCNPLCCGEQSQVSDADTGGANYPPISCGKSLRCGTIDVVFGQNAYTCASRDQGRPVNEIVRCLLTHTRALETQC